MRTSLSILLSAAAIAGCAPLGAKDAVTEPFVPVYTVNFPDPFVIPQDGRFLAYATNAEGDRANVQMATSEDLVTWAPLERDGKLHDAMPVLPRWAERGWTWAPEVLKLENRYLLFFTARETASGRQCTGVAESADPLGPFTSEATEPLVCQRDLGGTIDASPFRDTDGKLYLYYKADANAVGKPTEIFVQPMTPDGLGLTGKAVALLDNDQPWEAHVIESPTMVRVGEGYTLLYSHIRMGAAPAPVTLRDGLCDLRRADGAMQGRAGKPDPLFLCGSRRRVPQRTRPSGGVRGERPTIHSLPRPHRARRVPQCEKGSSDVYSSARLGWRQAADRQ